MYVVCVGLAEEQKKIVGNLKFVATKFVLAQKHKDIGETLLRAPFVIGGHRDRDERHTVHNASATKTQSVRSVLALSASSGFDVWSLDADHAYLQSTGDIGRDVSLRTNPVRLEKGELINTLRPIYGFADAGGIGLVLLYITTSTS